MTPAEILAARRAAQIARLEGRGGESTMTHEAAQAAAAACAAPAAPRPRSPRARLHFRGHARVRMSQRGMSARIVYDIWRFGEPRPSGRGYTVHHLSRTAMEGLPAAKALELDKWRGAAIVVRTPTTPGLDPELVTVLADGEDTKFYDGRGKRPPRWQRTR